MGLGGVLLALSAVQAVSQIGAGYAEKAEADANASAITSYAEGQANLIDIQKGIENKQYFKAKGIALSKGMAKTAGMGIMPQGSILAVMLDTQKEMSLDQAIGQYNFDQEKRYVKMEADFKAENLRMAGKNAVRAGWSNAFSTVLKGVSNYAMTKVMTPKNTTFDVSVKTPNYTPSLSTQASYFNKGGSLVYKPSLSNAYLSIGRGRL